METVNAIVAVVVAAGGGAGISSILTTLFSHRKYREESKKIQIENEKTIMEYVTNALQKVNDETRTLHEDTKKEVSELRKENAKLAKKVDVLNSKLSSLMNWIVGDDHRYRSWLEKRLHELDPDIVFPDLPDPPNVFGDEWDGDDEDEDFKTHPPSSNEETTETE